MQKIHFLGIGGSGASAAAAIAEAQGFEVTGCDKDIDNDFTKPFTRNQLFLNHNPNHLSVHPGGGDSNIDILAITPAILSLDPDNRELREARKRGIEAITWQQFTGKYLMKDKFVIAVCGTHGKTTTTAMIAKILEDVNLDPTVLIGAIVPKWNTNFRTSSRHPELVSGSKRMLKQVQYDNKKEYFVIEADEFNDNFLSYKPNITVVTNIEMDHPEYFKDLNSYMNSFEKFLLQTKQTIIVNLLDPNIAEIVKDVMKQSKVTSIDFTKIETEFNLQIPGQYNILNSKAAMQTALVLGIDPKVAKQSLESYAGTGRRFDLIGEYHKAKVYSDFGHHPTEVKVTVEAAREKFPTQRLFLIYQPHMFSRTKALFDDFVKVFRELPVDGVAILDIYPSREIDTSLVTSKQLVDAVDRENVEYATWEELKKELQETKLTGNDVIFFMGAGDSDKWAKELIHGTKVIPHSTIENGGYIKLSSDGVDFFVEETKGIKIIQ